MASSIRESIVPPREVLVSWLARLYRHGLTTTTGGNLSLLDDDGTMYITPSGGDKAIVPPEKVAFRQKGETKFQGPAPPSMEWPLHTAAYEARPDCKAVLHAHSMTLVAFSLATEAKDPNNGTDSRLPDTRVLLGAYQVCGKVAFAPYELPGSQSLADQCKKAFDEGADCVILQNHGVVVVGKNIHQAYDRFVSLEYLARSIVHSSSLNMPARTLSDRILKYAVDPDSKDPDNPFPKKIPSAPFRVPARSIAGAEKEERATLCKFVHRAYNQNLVTSSSGSFSARLGAKDGEDLSFIITPTDVDRRSLEPSHLCFVSSDSQPARKKQEFETNEPKLRFHPMHPPGDPEKVSPSRATALHGSIYSMHPEVNYIMVVQPPFATSYCITGRPFNSAGIPESHIILQNVQSLSIDSVLENNGVELSRALDPSAGKSTILVEGYGLVTVGQDLLKTFVQVEVCESMCGVSLTALRRGPVTMLTKKQVQEIDSVFKMAH